MKAGCRDALLALRDLAVAIRYINSFKKRQRNMLKQRPCSAFIVVLKRLKPPYKEIHKVCRKLHVVSRQNIV